MRNSTLWGIALAAVIGSGAVAATSLAPAYSTVTRDADGAVSYTLTPAPGDMEITSLQNITLTFPDIEGVAVAENVTNPIVLKNNSTGVEYVCYSPDLQSRAEGGTQFVLVFSEEIPEFPEEAGEETALPTITEEGAYTLTIKEGAFVYGEEVDGNGDVTVPNSIPTPEIIVNYSIGVGIDYTLSPASGAEVSDLSMIQIKFPTVKGVEFEANYTNSILLVNETTGTEYKLAGDPDFNSYDMQEGTTYDMHFVKIGETDVKAINEPGKYTLSIKQGAFYYGEDNKKVQAISASYSIAGVEYVLNPSNDEPVEDLQQITINFPTLDDVEFMDNYTNSITLTNMSVGAEEEINAEYVLAGAIKDTRSMNPGSTYVLTFIKTGDDEVAPIIEPGKYVLEIKAGAFVYGRPVAGDADADTETPETPDSELNKVQAISAVYTISGVEYTLTPSTGTVGVMDLSSITLNLPTVSDVEFVDKFVNSILLENLTTGEVYTFAGAVPNTFSTLPGTTLDLKFVPEGEEEVVPIVQPGDYKLTIKRGAIVYNGGENIVQSIVALYRIPGINYSLNPAAGYVEEINTIELAFPTVKGVDVVENYTNSILLTNVTTGVVYNVSAERNTRVEEGTAYTLHFIKEGQEDAAVIIEPGQYELLIKEGAFDYANESEDAELEGERIKVQEISATYKIAGIAYTFDPASGSYVEDLSTITISFPEYKGINVLDANEYVGGIVLENTTTGVSYVLAGADMNSRTENGTSYILHFSSEVVGDVEPITLPGNYELSIKEGVFYYGDDLETAEKLPAMSAQYVIEGTPIVLSPANGETLEEISVITINFITDQEVEFAGIKDPSVILLTNTETEEVYTLAGDPGQVGRTENDGITYEMRFVAEGEDDAAVIRTAGTYVLTINEGAFTIGEELSPALEATYFVVDTTTSVSEVLGEEASEYNVYTINGVQVLKNADKNAVNALPAGLYIINGKKVIVK